MSQEWLFHQAQQLKVNKDQRDRILVMKGESLKLDVEIRSSDPNGYGYPKIKTELKAQIESCAGQRQMVMKNYDEKVFIEHEVKIDIEEFMLIFQPTELKIIKGCQN